MGLGDKSLVEIKKTVFVSHYEDRLFLNVIAKTKRLVEKVVRNIYISRIHTDMDYML